MTPENFVWWLQGFSELSDGTLPTLEQWKSISDHLALVFNKLTPPVNFHEKADDIKLPPVAVDWSDYIPKQEDWYTTDPSPQWMSPSFKPGILTC